MMKGKTILAVSAAALASALCAENLDVKIDTSKTYQTIDNFAAAGRHGAETLSDAISTTRKKGKSQNGCSRKSSARTEIPKASGFRFGG